MTSTPSQSQGDRAEVTTAASTTEWPGGLFIGVWGESAGGHLAALIALTAHRPELEGNARRAR
jgi:acetyl esterase/lipase